jgi:ankyrin repeat protein
MYVSVKIALCVVVFLQEGITALILAASRGHKSVVDELLAAETDIDKQNEVGWTALIYAARQGHQAIVEVLLAAGANTDLQDMVTTL